LYKSYGQDSCISQGVFKVAPFDGLIFIYQTDPVGYASKRVFLKFVDFTNFIMLRIYAEALDRLRVRLNMYLVLVRLLVLVNENITALRLSRMATYCLRS